MRWWAKIKIEDRICSDVTLSADSFEEALFASCEHFDLAKPIVTGKHEAEIRNFFRTVFYPDDFVEECTFDTFEIEKINVKKRK